MLGGKNINLNIKLKQCNQFKKQKNWDQGAPHHNSNHFYYVIQIVEKVNCEFHGYGREIKDKKGMILIVTCWTMKIENWKKKGHM